MSQDNYITVAHIQNDTASDMRLYLEMLCEEIVLSSGHSIELLARPSEGLLPITVGYVKGGLQVHAHKEVDPDWYIKIRGQLIRPGHPTILSEYD